MTNIVSMVLLGVSSIIGSGWLFAPYFAAKYSGPLSLISWVLAASICLILVLMLTEIVSLYPIKGLLSRLLTLSHNKDLGFVMASSYWFSTILFAPAEAQTTVQYISFLFPSFKKNLMHYDEFTILGYIIVAVLIVIYCFINYWGLKFMSKISNIITLFKLIIPLGTGIILLCTTFNSTNFFSYRSTFAPYGITSIFTTLIYGGVFYSFLGFTSMAAFVSEVSNPKRNIPLVLILSIIICLVIYLVLQVAYIGSIPPYMLLNGWHNVFFTSPLIQLILLFKLNYWSVILYIDAFVSPSSAGLIIIASSTRALSSMAEDKQAPNFLSKTNMRFNFSRSSLIVTMIACIVAVVFFKTWHDIIILVTSLQLLTYISIPLSLVKFRMVKKDSYRSFKLIGGNILGFLMFLTISYILTKEGFKEALYTLFLNIIVFIIYIYSKYKFNYIKMLQSILSAWSIFVYLIIIAMFNFFDLQHIISNVLEIIIFFVFGIVSYIILLYQKNYNEN